MVAILSVWECHLPWESMVPSLTWTAERQTEFTSVLLLKLSSQLSYGLAVTTEPVPEHDIARIHILAVHSSIRAESLSPVWHT